MNNKIQSIAKATLTLFVTSVFSSALLAQEAPTYSRDVAPILQEKCATCHNPEGIGPMPLLNYEQVKPFALLIKDRTGKRVMPPWHLDPTVGIQQFKNDASLSDEQIATIAAWADAGAPEGNPADLPPPMAFPSGAEWQLADELG
ncbi:MAG: cytochrome c, partial [Pseudomonadales bacterium]|nr:cytochrome c [Pseudomonadales bacterium]